MNINIITFIDSYNYGAFLQAKATEIILLKIGYHAEFLNYSNPEEANQRKIFYFSPQYSTIFNLKRILYKLWKGYWHREIINGKRNFKKVNSTLPRTRKFNTVEAIENDVPIDILICGSDQIWNPEIFNGVIDPVYFGWIRNVKKKIAFSSSLGSHKPNANEQILMEKYFEDFNAIAVREEFTKSIIESLTENKHVEVVLDPTLCLTAEEWKSLFPLKNNFRKHNTNYILLYFVNPKIECQPLIDYIRNKLQYKVLWIKHDNIRKFNVDEIICDATPYDFIELIFNAKFVLTDSFHGTAFSINMNTNFISILNPNNPERVKHLCKMLNLEGRMVNENACLCDVSNIDFTFANKKLSEMRSASIAWLANAMM